MLGRRVSSEVSGTDRELARIGIDGRSFGNDRVTDEIPLRLEDSRKVEVQISFSANCKCLIRHASLLKLTEAVSQ